jgi:hypothetical protein
MFRGPPKASELLRIATGTPQAREITEMTKPARPWPCANDVIDVHPATPLTITREILARESIVVGPLPHLESMSDISIYSTASMSFPNTPSPPPSPPMVQVVTPESDILGEGMPNSASALDPSRDLVSEVDVLSKTSSPETHIHILSDASPRNICEPHDNHCAHPVDSNTQGDRIAPYYPRSASPDSSGIDSSHEILSSDSSSDRSMSDLISDTEDFDWPIPPGPIFRLKSDGGDDSGILSAVDYVETVLKLRVQSPVLPLRIVKRNAVSSRVQIFTHFSSSDSDTSEYSPPPSPSPVADVSLPHVFDQEILVDTHIRDERSQMLNSILSSFPREELIVMSNLPSGTVVTFDSAKETTEADDFPNDKPESASALDTTTNDHTIESIPSVPHLQAAITRALEPPSQTSTTISSRSLVSPPSSPDSPAIMSPLVPVPPFLQRHTDKYFNPFDDTMARLEIEYKRWKAGFLQHDMRCYFMNGDHEDDGQWRDVFALQS